MSKFSISKLLLPILAISINLSGFSGAANTRSYFSDREISSGNTFIADPLGFSVDAGPFSGSVSESGPASMPLAVTNRYAEDFELEFFTRDWQGDLCAKLDLAAASQENISGFWDLAAFRHQAGLLSATNGIWTFTAALKPGATGWEEQNCAFNIVAFARQAGGGYVYEKTVRAMVVADQAKAKDFRPEPEAPAPVESEVVEMAGQDNIDPGESESGAPEVVAADKEPAEEAGEQDAVDDNSETMSEVAALDVAGIGQPEDGSESEIEIAPAVETAAPASAPAESEPLDLPADPPPPAEALPAQS